jgi:hypothetical protein
MSGCDASMTAWCASLGRVPGAVTVSAMNGAISAAIKSALAGSWPDRTSSSR